MPVLRGAVARRYAQAVFELARDGGRLEEWRGDLGLLAEAFGDPDLSFYLENPKVTLADKKQVLATLLDGRVSPEARQLAAMLVERGRIAIMPRLLAEFVSMLNDYRGVAVARVVTAVPLTDAETEAVSRRLSALVGKNVDLHTEIDESILGGLVARVDDQLIDGSLATRLQKLKAQMESA